MRAGLFATSAWILCLASSGFAQAATVVSEATPVNVTPVFVTPSSVTGTVVDPTSSVANLYASPFGPGSTAKYVAIESGSADYDFGALYNTVSLAWGSPDSYNTLTFVKGGVPVDSIVGEASFPGQVAVGSHLSNYYVTIRSSASFDGVQLSSTAPAFEFDDLTVSSVPLPTALPMFAAALIALAGFGYGLNRWVAPNGDKVSSTA